MLRLAPFCLFLAAAILPALAQPTRPAQGGVGVEAAWTGEPRWLRGGGFSGGAFDGGVLFATDVPFGSTIAPEETPAVRLVFDADLATTTRVYRADDGYADQGTGVFHGAAYDVSDPANPRRLNVVASEDARTTDPDNTWNPTTGTRGGREYLLVMASDYDASGGAYAEANPFQDEQDAYYFVALQLVDGHALFEAPGALDMHPLLIQGLAVERVGDGAFEVTWSYDAPSSAERLVLYADTTAAPATPVAEFSPSAQQGIFSTLEYGPYRFRLEALDAEGHVVAWSATASLLLEPATIEPFSAEHVGDGAFALAWSYAVPPSVERIVAYADLSEMPTTAVAEFAPTAQQATVSVDEDGLYAFRIEALGAGGRVVARSPVRFAQTTVAQGTTLLGHLDPSGSASYADIWGYTDPATGREYALLCDRFEGLHIIDVTDGQPVLTSTVSGYSSDAKDVKVWNQYAYLIQETAPAVVIDLSDPADPQVVGRIENGPGGGAHNAEVHGDHLYLMAAPLRIYDLAADPTDPPFVGEYPIGFHDIHFNGDRAYASVTADEGVFVLDVSDPTAPELETQIIYPAGYMGAHSACSSPDGSYLYVNDEVGTGPWMRAFDVRDIENVELTAEVVVDARTSSHNCYVEGDFLFLAHYSAGLQVFDIGEDPAAPEPIGFYDTHLGPPRLMEGAWSVFPYFASGKVVVSDMVTGLYVVEVDGYDGTPVAADEAPAEAPALALRAFPNPTAGRATLRYALPEAGRFRLALFDVLGREVAALAEGDGVQGVATAPLAPGLAPGLYLARLETAAGAVTTRITVAR